MGAGMLFRSFERLTTAAVVVTVVLMFAVPFVLGKRCYAALRVC
jgi:hypothetical protein